MNTSLSKAQSELVDKIRAGATLVHPAGGRPLLKPAGGAFASNVRADTVRALADAGVIRLGARRDRFNNPVYELVEGAAAPAPAPAPAPAGWPFPTSAHAWGA